jgi:pimeloyl-ACP methyl ester carboxylesterase
MSTVDVGTGTSTEVVTHQTAETRSVDAGGVRFAFRRFGAAGATPLVLLQHFRGNLDNWDPALTDALAGEREVILVDYPGAGSSGGEFGPTIADTARQMIDFVEALELSEIDLLGFSIGGFVAQEIALIRPALPRRLVLAATGPKGGPGMHGWRPCSRWNTAGRASSTSSTTSPRRCASGCRCSQRRSAPGHPAAFPVGSRCCSPARSPSSWVPRRAAPRTPRRSVSSAGSSGTPAGERVSRPPTRRPPGRSDASLVRPRRRVNR